MAKAKKSEAADAGATKKQATETKKAPSESKARAAAPKTTKAAAGTTKAAATTSKSASASEKSSAGDAATKKKAPAKPSGAPSTVSSMPLIDTSLAAETAAKFVVNRALLGNAATRADAAPPQGQGDAEAEDDAAPEKRESSAFKQLKAGLNKPSLQGPGGILGGAGQNKKGNTPFGGGNQQVGRNQTFGADVNRSGVPRRTGG